MITAERPAEGTDATADVVAAAHRRRRRWFAATVGFALLAAVASLAVEHQVFPLGSPNRDESTYADAARMARNGRFTLPASTHEAFRPWASGRHGDRIVLKYLPPWPVTLAAFGALGVTALAAPIMAALLVLLIHALTRELVGGDGPAPTVAAAAIALSPIVAFQGGTVLPYLFQLVLEVAAGLLLLRSRRRVRVPELLAAGLLFGVALFARQFDAVVTVAPFVVVAAWRRWRILVPFAVGAALPAAGLLAFDAAVMGSPLRLPFTVTGSTDSLGFGTRGVFRGLTVPFSPANGLTALALNLAWFGAWTAGGPLLLVAAIVGWRAAPRAPAHTALTALAAVIPLAFVPFWGSWAVVHFWPGTMTLGPFYHLALLVPLAVFGGVGGVELAHRMEARRGTRRGRRAVVAGGIAVVAVTALLLPPKLAANAPYTRRFRAARAAVERVPAPALVLLPDRGVNGFDSWTPALGNDPSLDQPRLYVDDRGANLFGVLDRFPDRRAYRVSMLPRVSQPATFRAEPVTVVRGDTVDITVSTRVPAGAGPGASAYLVDSFHETSRRPVRSSEVWRVAPAALERASGLLAIGVDVPRGRRSSRWEVRIPYRRMTDGTVELLLPARGFRRVAGVWEERDVSAVVSVASWHVGAQQGK